MYLLEGPVFLSLLPNALSLWTRPPVVVRQCMLMFQGNAFGVRNEGRNEDFWLHAFKILLTLTGLSSITNPSFENLSFEESIAFDEVNKQGVTCKI